MGKGFEGSKTHGKSSAPYSILLISGESEHQLRYDLLVEGLPDALGIDFPGFSCGTWYIPLCMTWLRVDIQ